MFNDKKFQKDFNAYMVNVKPSDKLVNDTIAMLQKEQQRLEAEKSTSKENRLMAFLANPAFRRYSALACTVLLSLFAVKLYNSTVDDKVPVAPIETPIVTTTEETTLPLDEPETTNNLLEITSITSGTSYLNSYDDYVTNTNTLQIEDVTGVTSTVGVSIADVTTTTAQKFEFNGTTTTTIQDYNNVTSMWAVGGITTTMPVATPTETHTSTFTLSDNGLTGASTTKPTTSESVSVSDSTTSNTTLTSVLSTSASTSIATTTVKPTVTTTATEATTIILEGTTTEVAITTSNTKATTTLESNGVTPEGGYAELTTTTVLERPEWAVTTAKDEDEPTTDYSPEVYPDDAEDATATATLRNLNYDYTYNSVESMQKYPYTAVRFLLKNSKDGYYHDGTLDMDRIINDSPFCMCIPNEDSVVTISQTDDYCDVVIFYNLYYEFINQNVNVFVNISPIVTSERELMVPLICESFSTLDDVSATLETLKIDNLSLKYLPIKRRVDQISYLNS